MYRLSIILTEVLQKYLPLLEKGEIEFNLDFKDTTKTISNPDELRAQLDIQLGSALKRTSSKSSKPAKNAINIAVEDHKIKITDTGTVLSPTACALLSSSRIRVKSRIGFGTTVEIPLETTSAPVK